MGDTPLHKDVSRERGKISFFVLIGIALLMIIISVYFLDPQLFGGDLEGMILQNILTLPFMLISFSILLIAAATFWLWHAHSKEPEEEKEEEPENVEDEVPAVVEEAAPEEEEPSIVYKENSGRRPSLRRKRKRLFKDFKEEAPAENEREKPEQETFVKMDHLTQPSPDEPTEKQRRKLFSKLDDLFDERVRRKK